MDTELFREWFQAFAKNAGITLHVETLYGENSHHIAETCGGCHRPQAGRPRALHQGHVERLSRALPPYRLTWRRACAFHLLGQSLQGTLQAIQPEQQRLPLLCRNGDHRHSRLRSGCPRQCSRAAQAADATSAGIWSHAYSRWRRSLTPAILSRSP